MNQTTQHTISLWPCAPTASARAHPKNTRCAFYANADSFVENIKEFQTAPNSVGANRLKQHIKSLNFSVFARTHKDRKPKDLIFVINQPETTSPINNLALYASIHHNIMLPIDFNTGQPYIPFDEKQRIILSPDQTEIAKALGSEPATILRARTEIKTTFQQNKVIARDRKSLLQALDQKISFTEIEPFLPRRLIPYAFCHRIEEGTEQEVRYAITREVRFRKAKGRSAEEIIKEQRKDYKRNREKRKKAIITKMAEKLSPFLSKTDIIDFVESTQTDLHHRIPTFLGGHAEDTCLLLKYFHSSLHSSFNKTLKKADDLINGEDVLSYSSHTALLQKLQNTRGVEIKDNIVFLEIPDPCTDYFIPGLLNIESLGLAQQRIKSCRDLTVPPTFLKNAL